MSEARLASVESTAAAALSEASDLRNQMAILGLRLSVILFKSTGITQALARGEDVDAARFADLEIEIQKLSVDAMKFAAPTGASHG